MEELEGFENEQLRPFLPVLMLSAFPNDASAEDNLDLLRSRLIDIHAGNQFLQYMKLDFASIDSKCQEVWRSQGVAPRPNNFMQLSCVDKVIAVCTHLISKMHKYAPSNAADAFDPFDIEHCQEEAVWIMTLASLHMPDIFALSKFANVLLAYTNGPRLLVMAVLNQPDAYDSVLRGMCSLNCPDEDGFLMHQRSEAVKLLLQLDRADALALLNRAVAAEKLYPLAVDILCCDVVDDLYFVDFLISQLMSSGHAFGAYIVKSTHRQYLKKFCDRLGRILIRTK
ncbi:hypothetical protein AAVH_06213 [Aphelenchoides avenae]|nr:hypothetical protein AAVH_06213 [Aphelenchus avenae]